MKRETYLVKRKKNVLTRNTEYGIRNTRKFQNRLLAWFSNNKRDLPWRKNKNPYRVWISEIMLQQTQVVTVIPYYKKWLKKFPTIKALSAAKESEVLKQWEGLGYYSRARNLQKGACYITKELQGRFPCVQDELIKVPGIGPYTAGAIASIAFGKSEPLVDGNVGRVFARLFKIPGIWNEVKANKKLWKIAAELIPQKTPGDFNEALMELGATVCTKDNPSCSKCPVKSMCQAYQENLVDRYPTSKKSRTIKLEKLTLILKRGNRVLVRRKKRDVMKGLYEFPTFQVGNSGVRGQGRGVREMLKNTKLQIKNPRVLGQVSHGYTKYRAKLNIVEGRLLKGSLKHDDYEVPQWVEREKLKDLTFASVFRKIEKSYV